MVTHRVMGLLVFSAVCCVLITVASGGAVFVQRPVRVTYLVLWGGWWLVIAVDRRRGAKSAYDKSQRPVLGRQSASGPSLTRADLDEFVACYSPTNRCGRTVTRSEEAPDGRWCAYAYEELMARDKVNL